MSLAGALASALGALTGALALSAGGACAQAPEKKDIKLGVGGAAALYYLPLALTERLGHFKEQGLNVEISDFKGGSQSLTALVGGSVDVVTGAYEHTLRMQAKGQDIVCVIELGRYPGIALAVRKDRADKIKTVADLKGAKIGVTAPGSSTNMIVAFLMAKAGLKPDDASFVGVGATASAVAAIQKGEIDALSNVDPAISKLQSTGDVVVLAETRTTEGTAEVLGGPMSAAVLYLKREFAAKNPATVQALVNAFYKTLKWLDKATPAEIAEKVPQEYWLGDKELYVAAVKNNLQVYSRDGIVSAESRQRSLDFLKKFDKEMAAATVDPATTWDGRFVAKAAETLR
ncbi:MAG TPA: ABC transporter substrate-binding protein [Hyphomicrobiaceae bacterium]|nr:ABC transporter substrate-binding protein [Hyphomicrobiaceae bacterium]